MLNYHDLCSWSWFPRSAWEPLFSDAPRRTGGRRASQTVRFHAERGNEGFHSLVVLSLLLTLAGCGSHQLPTAPVEGKVLFQGKPLEFGGVVFRPTVGPLARGEIQPDGTFRLSVYRDGDGAVISENQVQIVCYESQRPGAPPQPTDREPELGKSLIPEKYAHFDTSGVRIEVKAKNEPMVFDLVGPAGR